MNKKKIETSESIAKYFSEVILSNAGRAGSLYLTEQTVVETGFVENYSSRISLRGNEGITASFELIDESKSARKRWRVIVEMIEDSRVYG